MSADPPGDVSRLLAAIQDGEAGAKDQLCRVLYAELHRMAEGLLAQERQGHSLQASDLINEVLLRLLQDDVLARAPNHHYLFGAAAEAMRRLLVDHARRRRTQKRGGDWRRTPLDDALDAYEGRNIDLLALNEALERLQALHPRQYRVVDEYHFGGFTMREIAEHLGVSEATVCNDFKRAQQWLAVQVGGEL